MSASVPLSSRICRRDTTPSWAQLRRWSSPSRSRVGLSSSVTSGPFPRDPPAAPGVPAPVESRLAGCHRGTPSSRATTSTCCPRWRAEFGEVDLVYIDPPYNTGNDFAYVDDIRAQDGLSRHEAWVAMMRPRLLAARDVMSARSAIWVSIDDNEAAYLRLLMDEVFGEANFLAQVVVNLNPKGRQLGGGFATSHEYLLVYARDARTTALDASSTETVDERDFPLEAADGRRYRHLPLRNTNKKFNPVTAPTLHFPVWGDPEGGAVRTAPFEGAVEVTPVFGDGTPAVWRWSRPLIDERPGRPGLPADQRPGRRAGRRVPEGLAPPRRTAAAAARSCARSGWPRRSARPTPRWPSSRTSWGTCSSRRSRPAWCAGSSGRCRTTCWSSTSSRAAARPGTRSRWPTMPTAGRGAA